jgi:uncharacterized membrane protein YhaH (DUF805 family)
MFNPIRLKGRLRRIHFFGVFVTVCSFMMALGVVFESVASSPDARDEFLPFFGIFGWVLLWISFASAVQRAHDVGKSAWFVTAPCAFFAASFVFAVAAVYSAGPDGSPFVLLCLVPAAAHAGLVTLFLMLKAGDSGTNRFGDCPRPTKLGA